MERAPIHFIRFIALVFIQVFLLKNIGFYNLFTPFLYILFILLLPFQIPNWLLFSLSFGIGLSIDTFYDTLGLHALACTVLAYVRIIFIRLTVSTEDRESEPEPSMSKMGFRWFLFYGFILTLFHHLALFSFEVFRLSGFGITLLRTVLSSFFTLFLLLLTEFLFYRKKVR
jgi:rod shape-determining protein MreD